MMKVLLVGDPHHHDYLRRKFRGQVEIRSALTFEEGERMIKADEEEEYQLIVFTDPFPNLLDTIRLACIAKSQLPKASVHMDTGTSADNRALALGYCDSVLGNTFVGDFIAERVPVKT